MNADTHESDTPASSSNPADFHFRVGWHSLVVFMLLGTALETMHGFKIGWYLDVSNETRRLMWPLTHTRQLRSPNQRSGSGLESESLG